MATTADVASQVATAIEALATAPTRMTSDHRDDLDGQIAAGSAKYQLRVAPAGRDYDSNNSRVLASVEFVIAHRLADHTDEVAYTEGNLQTDISALTTQEWWRAFAAVYVVTDDIAISIERIGHIIVCTGTITVSVSAA